MFEIETILKSYIWSKILSKCKTDRWVSEEQGVIHWYGLRPQQTSEKLPFVEFQCNIQEK